MILFIKSLNLDFCFINFQLQFIHLRQHFRHMIFITVIYVQILVFIHLRSTLVFSILVVWVMLVLLPDLPTLLSNFYVGDFPTDNRRGLIMFSMSCSE